MRKKFPKKKSSLKILCANQNWRFQFRSYFLGAAAKPDDIYVRPSISRSASPLETAHSVKARSEAWLLYCHVWRSKSQRFLAPGISNLRPWGTSTPRELSKVAQPTIYIVWTTSAYKFNLPCLTFGPGKSFLSSGWRQDLDENQRY